MKCWSNKKLLRCWSNKKLLHQLNPWTFSADFRVSWPKWPCPFLTRPTQKSLKQLFTFQNLHHHAKNQYIASIHSWDTANFRVSWPDWPKPISGHANIKIFWWTFNLCEFVSTCKISDYFIDLFWRYGWLKNPAIWLAENILAHISGTKIFPNTGFVQEHSK